MKYLTLLLLAFVAFFLGACANDDHQPTATYSNTTRSSTSYSK